MPHMPRLEYELRSFSCLLFAGTAGVFMVFGSRSPLLVGLAVIMYFIAKVQMDRLAAELIGKDEL